MSEPARLPGPVVEDALRPYTDNPRHAAIAVLNALRQAGLKPARPGAMRNPNCRICGDPDDHDGRPHAQATGDGRTRADG